MSNLIGSNIQINIKNDFHATIALRYFILKSYYVYFLSHHQILIVEVRKADRVALYNLFISILLA
jgi:hypothetical protein